MLEAGVGISGTAEPKGGGGELRDGGVPGFWDGNRLAFPTNQPPLPSPFVAVLPFQGARWLSAVAVSAQAAAGHPDVPQELSWARAEPSCPVHSSENTTSGDVSVFCSPVCFQPFPRAGDGWLRCGCRSRAWLLCCPLSTCFCPCCWLWTCSGLCPVLGSAGSACKLQQSSAAH